MVKNKFEKGCCIFYKYIIMDIDMPVMNGIEAT